MKARYATLDGMRGIAALFVVARHFGDLRGHGGRDQLSYLAVDFFFVLSGFVLAHSYGDKLANGRLTLRSFAVARVVRLWPLYLLGLALPVSFALHDGLAGYGGVFGFAKVLVRAAVLLPSNIGRHDVTLFPLNPPAWSLFFELYVANLLFAIIPWWRSAALLGALIAASAACLVVCDLIFGTVDTGVTGSTIAGGIPRVTYSFFLGCALQEIRRRYDWPRQVPALVPILALIVILVLSRGGVAGRLTELVAVLFVLPLIVFFGAGATERRPEIGKAFGDASYAVYVLHFGLIEAFGRLMRSASLYPGVGLEALFLALIAIMGWAADRYDQRVRRFIAARISS